MSRLILYMATSLDGFITGPGDDKGNPAGVGGMRLQAWLGDGGPQVADWRPTDRQSRIVFDEMMSTGAVVTGRRTGDFVDYWGGDHHDGVPIFVPTHTAPADNRHERVHFVTEGIEAYVEQAKAAAGDRDVMLHGAHTAQECLRAGVLDVLEIQLMPVLLALAPNADHRRSPLVCLSEPGRATYAAIDRADLETTARVLEELCRRLEADDAQDTARAGGEGGNDANSA